MEEEVHSENTTLNIRELHLLESSTGTCGQNEAYNDRHVAESIDKDDQTKEELQEQPLTNQNPGTSVLPVQEPPTVPGSNQLEEIIILDQNGQALQCERMVIVTGQSQNGQVYVIPSSQLTTSQVLIPHAQLLDIANTTGSGGQKSSNQEQLHTVPLTAISGVAGNASTETNPSSKNNSDAFVTPVKPLPRNAPSWALRLRSCEKIGDSYRGFCSTEAELEAVLILHKQQTQAVFGTRQSPSPAKAATRLMWKSQYVPYDGIPFVNAGSRAIVMECQFGPRRKGQQPKKNSELESQNGNYKATCPARIYIKKVRKFPEYRVPTDPKVDKKVVRQEQEKAFFNLKKSLRDVGGVIRYYVQLPTQKAHLYHDVEAPPLPPPPLPLPLSEEDGEGLLGPEEEEEEEEGSLDDGSCMPSRLHPLVAEKIKQLVAQGYSQVYTVRKQLRKFVEREMFKTEKVPERHNLCYFPTVNDIKNHIHEAQKALESQQQPGFPVTPVDPQWAGDDLLTETVTLTLTPASMEVSPQKCSVLEGSDTLSPEAMQLFSSLSSLQPKIFAQLQGIQLQPVSSPADGSLPHQTSSSPSPSSSTALPLCPTAPDFLEPSSPSLASQPLLMGPTSFLPSSATLVEGGSGSVAEPPTALLGMGQLVSVTALGGSSREGGAMHQILLEDGQSIPVQIVDPATLALTPLEEAVQVKEESEDTIISSDNPSGE